MNAQELQNGLVNFYGTENYHIFSILYPRIVLTDGAKFLADNAGGGAYWLMDAIASYQGKCRKDPMLRDMQFWTLTVHPDVNGKRPKYMATLICERDTGDVAIKQKIPYTDFPLPEIKLWVESDGERSVILLPSEH